MEKYYHCSSCNLITPSDKPIKKCACGGNLVLGIEGNAKSFLIDDEEKDETPYPSPFCCQCHGTDLRTIDEDPEETINIYECKKCGYVSIFDKKDLAT